MKREKQALTPAQVNALVNAAETLRDKAFIAVLYLTGARVSEVARVLATENFARSSTHLIVRVPTLKNRRQPFRHVPLPIEDPLTQTVLAYLQQASRTEPLWPFSRQYAHRLLKRLGRRIGVADLHPHMLRHTRLTHAAVYGDLHEFDLMRFAGWSGPEPARTYVHMTYQDIMPKLSRLSRALDAERRRRL